MEKLSNNSIWRDDTVFSLLQASYLWRELEPPEKRIPVKPLGDHLGFTELRLSDLEQIQADLREQSLDKKRRSQMPAPPQHVDIVFSRLVKAIAGKKLKAYLGYKLSTKAAKRPTYNDIYLKREDLRAYAMSINKSPSFLFPEGSNPIEELRLKKQKHIRDRVSVIEEIWKAVKKQVGYSARQNMDLNEARKRKREVALEKLNKIDSEYTLFKPEFFNIELFVATPGQERRDFVSKLLQRSLKAEGIDRGAFKYLGAKKGQVDSFRRVGLFEEYKEIFKKSKKI